EGLKDNLEGLSGYLDANGKVVGSHRDDVGDGDVFAALEGFESHWQKGRDEIREKVENLANMLGEAVSAFEQTDSDVSSAIDTE
ncbi:MAG: hypothetical protein LBJ08_06345, partial [Bifidobacteriaceae bacterium]|nr:hypothetical protein [Bifidobacteriaceae bacterium]